MNANIDGDSVREDELQALRRSARLSIWTIIGTAAVAIVGFIALAQAEAMEWWFEYTRAHEDWEIDELPLVLGVAGLWLLAFSLLSLRRHRRVLRALEREAKARRAAEEAAVRHLESRTFFFATASHELRTPLNAIIGFSELLREQPFGPIAQSEYDEPIRFINEAGADLLSTLNQMLDAQTILTNDNYPIAETEIDLPAMVSRIRALMAATMNRSVARIEFDNKADVTRLRFDPLRFSHLLKNMLSNALKFSPPDTDVVIRVSRGVNDDLLLSVIDQGPGLSEQAVQRALRSTADGEADLVGGLGFAIIRSVCEAHGCVFSIDSAPGRGATVTVRMGKDRVVDRPVAAIA